MLNGIDLLRVITLIYFNIEEEKYVPQKVHEVKAAFHMPLKQVEGIPIGSGGGATASCAATRCVSNDV